MSPEFDLHRIIGDTCTLRQNIAAGQHRNRSNSREFFESPSWDIPHFIVLDVVMTLPADGHHLSVPPGAPDCSKEV